MRRVIFLALILVIWVWSAPNVYRFAQIISKDGGRGYIDCEGKLWVISKKFKPELTKKSGISGDIWVPKNIPYLYFRLTIKMAI